MTELRLTSPASLGAAEKTSVILPAALAILLGAFLLLGAGFAHIDAVHNAAHDSRHAFAFPCH